MRRERATWVVVGVAFLVGLTCGVVHSDDAHDLHGRADNSTLLEVFVVPHSHDDVGWIISMDDYFFTEVQYIYDTVVDSLMRNPERRFTAIEVGYLEMWYRNADEGRRQDMHALYEAGQLEFQIGGIVMNDEAAASYVSIVNQVQRGHQFLTETFGAVPRFGWQIDPFGSSQGTPVLAAFDCFDGLVIARIPYEWKSQRMANQSLEFVWHGTGNLGAETDLFTHVMDTWSYCTPTGFSWGDDYDIYNPPNPNPPIWKGNVHARAEAFVSLVQEHAQYFATPNIIFPFGCDFQYQNADVMYKNMDKLIQYVNANQGEFNVHLQYARISDFFTALHNANHTWPTYEGDFFPYNDNAESYWSGYYTSRNKLKGMARQADSVLRTADVLVALAIGTDEAIDLTTSWKKIDVGRLQSAISQHHDGISGTARPQVVWDYEQRLEVGMASATEVAESALSALLSPESAGEGERATVTTDSSALLQLLEGNAVPLVATNDLAWNRTEILHVTVPTASVSVTDSEGYAVISQLMENTESGELELFFEAHIPALGYSTFFISPTQGTEKERESERERARERKRGGERTREKEKEREIMREDEKREEERKGKNEREREGEREAKKSDRRIVTTHVNGRAFENGSGEITNGFLTLYFNSGGVLESLYSRALSANVTLSQDLLEYEVSADPLQSGGAYILRNEGPAQSLSLSAVNETVEFQTGPLVSSCRRLWWSNVTLGEGSSRLVAAVQTFTLYTSAVDDPLVNNFVEVTYNVGPLDGNRDLVTRWSSGIQSNSRFSQDDSGFLVRERTYERAAALEVPRNYYPLVSTAYVQDDAARLSLLTAQSEGVTSAADGQLEAMLHRRTLQDDGRGLGAPLNDTDRIEVRHRLTYDTPSASESTRSVQRLLLNFPPGVFFGEEKGNDWAQYSTFFAPVQEQLPFTVHLLTLQQQSNSSATIVLRLQHLLQQNSGPLSADVTVDLSTLFKGVMVTNLVELSLSANQEATCKQERWVWATTDGQSSLSEGESERLGSHSSHNEYRQSNAISTLVTLRASEIKTFSCSLSPA